MGNGSPPLFGSQEGQVRLPHTPLLCLASRVTEQGAGPWFLKVALTLTGCPGNGVRGKASAATMPLSKCDTPRWTRAAEQFAIPFPVSASQPGVERSVAVAPITAVTDGPFNVVSKEISSAAKPATCAAAALVPVRTLEAPPMSVVSTSIPGATKSTKSPRFENEHAFSKGVAAPTLITDA